MIIFEEEDDRFYIGESTIKGAGKGLFAARRIGEGEFLPITGVMVRRGGVADRCTHHFNNFCTFFSSFLPVLKGPPYLFNSFPFNVNL